MFYCMVSWHCVVDCCCALFHGVPYNTVVQLVHTEKVHKTTQFLNCGEQFLKKNRKVGRFKQLLCKNTFKKNITYAPKSTLWYSVAWWWLIGDCIVLVQCWSGYSELFDYLILFPFLLLHLCSFLFVVRYLFQTDRCTGCCLTTPRKTRQ